MKQTPSEQNPDDKAAKKPDRKSGLGISKGVYALGNSLKDALIWGTALSVALIGVIAVGRDKSKAVRWMAEKIEKIHTGTKGLGSSFMGYLQEKTGMKINISGPEVAAALGVGWLFGHVVQGPSFVHGYKQAQGAEDKYNTLKSEKDRLVDVIAQQDEENQRFRAALQKQDATFAERTQPKPQETAAVNAR